MKEARIEARVKNNILWTAIQETGMNQSQFCRKFGFSPAILSGFITLLKTPFGEEGKVVPSAKRLAELLAIPPEDLFPSWLYSLKTTKTAIEFSLAELPPGVNPLLIPSEIDIERDLVEKDFMENFIPGLLTEKEKRIISLRFGLEGEDPMTLDDVADAVSLSRERVRQIMKVAFRRIRRRTERPPFLVSRKQRG